MVQVKPTRVRVEIEAEDPPALIETFIMKQSLIQAWIRRWEINLLSIMAVLRQGRRADRANLRIMANRATTVIIVVDINPTDITGKFGMLLNLTTFAM